MTDESGGVSRRGFMRTAAGASAATAAAGTASAQEGEGSGGEGGGGGEPDFGGYLDGVDGGFEDARGESEVTVAVGADGNGGAYAFSPARLWVDPGTAVKWEWTGEGGGHNVVAEDGPADLDSGGPVAESGVNYEHTFEEGGITTYFCDPHKGLDMLGGVAVGDDVPTAGGEGGGEQAGGGCTAGDLHACGVPLQAHFVGIAAVLMTAVSLVYTFFLLKYAESPHASGGD